MALWHRPGYGHNRCHTPHQGHSVLEQTKKKMNNRKWAAFGSVAHHEFILNLSLFEQNQGNGRHGLRPFGCDGTGMILSIGF